MTPFKVEITNLVTGEILPPGTQLALRPPRSPHFSFEGKEFLMTALSGARLLSRLQLKPTTHRVLWLVIANCPFGNEMRMSQQMIADELGIERPNVSPALAELVEHNIIEYTGTYCRVKTYRLNPAHFWRGSPHSHREAVAVKPPKPRLKVVANNNASA